MLTKKDIEEIAIRELKKYQLSTKITFFKYREFKKKAMSSPIIRQSIKEGNKLEELNIPALISHKTNTIYLSLETIQRLLQEEPLSLQKRFIQAIIIHEIFHLHSTKKNNINNFNTALRIEEETSKEFKKHYPGLAALGKRICKKYISR